MSGTPGSEEADRLAPRKCRRKTKTFSGCWTCRAKHVKCDEAKPACARCQRSGAACEGYGVRLSWAIQRDPSNFRSTRAARGGTGRSQVSLNSEDNGPAARETSRVDGDVESRRGAAQESPRIPEAPLSGSAGHDGHLSAPQPRSTGHGDPPPTSPPPDGNSSHWRSVNDPVSSPWTSTLETSCARLAPKDPSPRPATTTPSSNPTLLHTHGNPHTVTDISWLPTFDGDSPASFTQHPLSSHDAAPSEGLRHLDKLPDPGLQCEILEHWTLVLCDLLAPIPDFSNPLKTIFTPLALQGARQDAGVSTGAVALFHLICSASSFHLAKTAAMPIDRSRAFSNTALEHHNLGIMHLSRNIRRSDDDTDDRVAILASLIMCLYHESIAMYDPRWRLHIRGAVEWVNHVGPGFWHRDETASVMYQMYMGMAILIQSQILPWDRAGCGGQLMYDDMKGQKYALDTIFGIPQDVLRAVYTMNRIQQQEDGLASHDLRRLEMEMLLMAPSRVRREGEDASSWNAQVQFHHESLFYYSALVYLKRTLRKTAVRDVQSLVRQAMDHLEAVQTLIATGRKRLSPLVWPIAIIAFEAEDQLLQDRMARCLDVFTRCPALAIWAKFSESVQGLWARRRESPEEEDLCWHEYSPVLYKKYMLV